MSQTLAFLFCLLVQEGGYCRCNSTMFSLQPIGTKFTRQFGDLIAVSTEFFSRLDNNGLYISKIHISTSMHFRRR